MSPPVVRAADPRAGSPPVVRAADPRAGSPPVVGAADPRAASRAVVGAAVSMAAIGAMLLANGLWIPAKAELSQVLIAAAWQRARAGVPRPRPWPWADTWPVARLGISGSDHALFVLAGASGESMAFGPAHVAGSGAPGEADNVVIAGHRDTHFAFLRELEIGDELWLEFPGGRHRYRIEALRVVHESRGDLAERSGVPELTLVTCYPFDAILPGGPLRYVVHARRLGPGPEPRARSAGSYDESV